MSLPSDPYILTIPAPCDFLTANQRLHWGEKSRRVSRWRNAAAWAAKAAGIPKITEHVHITATIHRDHNRGRFDPNNWADTAKACVDGLVLHPKHGGADVLVDDSSRYVTGPDMRPGEPWADAALVLTITPRPQRGAVSTGRYSGSTKVEATYHNPKEES